MLSRRAFLAAPVLALAPADSVRREAVLNLPSGAVFSCPARRAHLVALMPAQVPIAVVSFGLDVPPARQTLLAFVGPGGEVWAVELLEWAAPDGENLFTRPALMPDRVHVMLQRSAARRQGTGWRREAWTDYLRFTGAGLADAPPRPVLSGTWQAALAARRAEIAVLLGARRGSVPESILAAFREAGSPVSV